MIDKERILASDRLPSLPGAAIKVLELTRGPDIDMAELTDTLKTDPALTARILRVLNSPLFGLRCEINAVDQAVVLLGAFTIGSLALGFSLFPESLPGGAAEPFYRRFWRSCVIHAVCADALARLHARGDPTTYFASGMLQDVGVLSLLSAAPDEYMPILEEAQTSDRELVDIERGKLGFSHLDISSELLARWNMPEDIQKGIAGHHTDPSVLKEELDPVSFDLACALATASAVAECFSRDTKSTAWTHTKEYLHDHYAMVEEESINAFLDQVRERVGETAQMVEVDLGSYPSCDDILAAANAQLAAQAVQAQIARQQADARSVQFEKEKDEYRNKAFRDPLTGIYNRSYFAEALEREYKRCSRYVDSLGVAFIDLDHFKKLNDTHGHKAGDEALIQASRALIDAVRDSDIVARYGGEEFVILLVRPQEDSFERLVDRLRQTIEVAEVRSGGTQISITASVGGVIAWPSRISKDPRDLIDIADKAMYEAKKGGRNQCRVVSLSD